jgi:hypothetical protein
MLVSSAAGDIVKFRESPESQQFQVRRSDTRMARGKTLGYGNNLFGLDHPEPSPSSFAFYARDERKVQRL